MSDSFLTKHLHDAGEGYFQHMKFTLWAAWMLIYGGVTVLIHGFLPFLFVHTGSCTIKRLNDALQARKAKCDAHKNG